MKLLSVIIPSYNVDKYLPTILPTYLSQEILEDVEILIVNDGSKDRTAEIGAEFQDKYPGTVRLINKENGGHGSTINKGIEEAAGTYFKVIDGDDWVDTLQFVRLVKQLRHIDADVIINPYVKVNIDSGEQTTISINGIQSEQTYQFDDIILALINIYQLHSITFKTSLLKNMRKIDEHCFYVDQEYILFPIDRITTVHVLDYPVYQYRVGNAEQSMSMKNMQKNRNMHKRVIMSLVDFLLSSDHSENITQFIGIKIQKMCQLQIDTYFSMSKCKETKRELMLFLHEIKQKNEKLYNSIPGKKAKCLRVFKSFGYEIIGMIKSVGKES